MRKYLVLVVVIILLTMCGKVVAMVDREQNCIGCSAIELPNPQEDTAVYKGCGRAYNDSALGRYK